jgi:hypothetical protein
MLMPSTVPFLGVVRPLSGGGVDRRHQPMAVKTAPPRREPPRGSDTKADRAPADDERAGAGRFGSIAQLWRFLAPSGGKNRL